MDKAKDQPCMSSPQVDCKGIAKRGKLAPLDKILPNIQQREREREREREKRERERERERDRERGGERERERERAGMASASLHS